MTKIAKCPHCDQTFFPEPGYAVDDCPACGRTVEVSPAPTDDEVREAVDMLESEPVSATFRMRKKRRIRMKLVEMGCLRTLLESHAAQAQRIGELEAELTQVQADARDIPTIAYLSGAADYKARAEKAEARVEALEADLAEAQGLLAAAHMDGHHKGQESVTEHATSVRIGEALTARIAAERRAKKAEAKVEALEWLLEAQEFLWTHQWPNWWTIECTKNICEAKKIVKAARAAVEESK